MNIKTSFLSLCLMPVLLYSQLTIPLYPGAIPNNKDLTGLKDTGNTFMVKNVANRFITRVVTPELIVYLPEKTKNTGIAVIICPGGGYGGLAIDHEGHVVAKKFIEHGIAGIVLKYRTPNPKYVNNKEVVPLMDAQQAILVVRQHAKEWKIKADRIGIMGSSAGGHLASTAGTHFNQPEIPNPGKISLRPDFMVLNYPVISFTDEVTHLGSRDNLLAENSNPIDPEKIKLYSNELQVDANTPPVFITHALDDKVVPIANTLLFLAALQKYHVATRSFFYAKGGHGFGLDNLTTETEWIDDCIHWLLSDRTTKKTFCSM
ncbi:MAG: alpha/beta hydrolase [Saprospiraceae bacterium]|nr:alpha/beta hydrolase [Saprospiraceae bacterium]